MGQGWCAGWCICTCRTSEEPGSLSSQQLLQQQIRALQVELRTQAFRWSAAHSQLQSQINALTTQNLELREALKVMGLQLLEAVERPAALLPTGQPGPPVQQAFPLLKTVSQRPVLSHGYGMGGCPSPGTQ
jgi:hypothetical protein